MTLNGYFRMWQDIEQWPQMFTLLHTRPIHIWTALEISQYFCTLSAENPVGNIQESITSSIRERATKKAI